MRHESRGRSRVVRPVLLCGWVVCLAVGLLNARMGLAETFNERFTYIGNWYITAASVILAVVFLERYLKTKKKDEGAERPEDEESEAEESTDKQSTAGDHATTEDT